MNKENKIEEYVDVVSSECLLTQWQRILLTELLKRKDSGQIFIMPRKFGYSTVYELAQLYKVLQGEKKE